mmetsp:Transcript_10478/g.19704  ORF Transcript_10478/g.19704 Transcript_10478/m.19704 type:complete len:282 (+) Transcript_10478:651-1496(+)
MSHFSSASLASPEALMMGASPCASMRGSAPFFRSSRIMSAWPPNAARQMGVRPYCPRWFTSAMCCSSSSAHCMAPPTAASDKGEFSPSFWNSGDSPLAKQLFTNAASSSKAASKNLPFIFFSSAFFCCASFSFFRRRSSFLRSALMFSTHARWAARFMALISAFLRCTTLAAHVQRANCWMVTECCSRAACFIGELALAVKLGRLGLLPLGVFIFGILSLMAGVASESSFAFLLLPPFLAAAFFLGAIEQSVVISRDYKDNAVLAVSLTQRISLLQSSDCG